VRSHVLRPLFVAVALVLALLVFRQLYVPHDFGVHGSSFTYNWYRAANIQDWKAVTVRYQGREYCLPCHRDKFESLKGTPHALIQCENCHGPGLDHPSKRAKLPIDTTRALCLRCHAKLPYPTSARGQLRGIDPTTHNPGLACVTCHYPHHPSAPYLQPGAFGQRRGNDYCKACHQTQTATLVGMPHAVIQCEDCHGPARNHPSAPPRLAINTARELCLRCHDKRDHNVGRTCITCHDPHRSSLQFAQFMPQSIEVLK
jgi:predicted CXXCH cytochrome family protein